MCAENTSIYELWQRHSPKDREPALDHRTEAYFGEQVTSGLVERLHLVGAEIVAATWRRGMGLI